MTENERFDMDKDIQYPDEEQIRSEIKAIMDRGLPERQNFCRRSVQIFTGPGLDVIFYRAKLIFLGSFLICLFLSQLCLMIGNFTEYSEYLVLMMYPLLHLIFHGLSCWAEEQSEVIELKMSGGTEQYVPAGSTCSRPLRPFPGKNVLYLGNCRSLGGFVSDPVRMREECQHLYI